MKRPSSTLCVAIGALLALLLLSCNGGIGVTPPPSESPKISTTATASVEATVDPDARTAVQCSYNVYCSGWVMDYADANNVVNEVFHPDSPFQNTHWDNPEFRDLVSQALIESDRTVRQGLWQRADRLLVSDDAVVLPLYYFDRTSLINPDIEYEYPPFGAPHYMLWQLPGDRDTLWVRLASEPVTVDISLAADSTSHAILNQIMEAPFRYDASGGIKPAGAESYEVSQDGQTYTIHLRRDAGWSDGEPVVAQHYVDGIIRLLDPETRAEYAYIMFYISGAEEFNSGNSTGPSTVGVEAIDDYTLEVRLDEPQSFFDSILAFSTMYPVRMDLIDQYGDSWTEPGNLVGNGPYVLSEWVHDDHLRLELNVNYHGADAITIQQVMLPIIDSSSSSLAAFERGELDVTGFPISELPRIQQEMPESIVHLPRPGVYYCAFNTQLHPTSNLSLRMALASAVDRRTILDEVMMQPWRREGCSVIPPEILGHQECGTVGYEYNRNAATAYLEAALAEMDLDNAGDLVVELWSTGGSVMQAVEEQWTNNLGITVDMVEMEWEDFLEARDFCND